jgi:hypothetical protein
MRSALRRLFTYEMSDIGAARERHSESPCCCSDSAVATVWAAKLPLPRPLSCVTVSLQHSSWRLLKE